MVSGFGMFICIATGVCAHFEARFVEGIMAAALTFWGFNLAGDGTAWANPAAWEGMFRIASEEVWGAICLAVGDLWLLGLTINGTFANTWYSRYSPVVRGCMAAAAAMISFLVYTSDRLHRVLQ